MLSLINEFGEYKFSINQIKEMKAVAISYDDFSAGELKEIIEPDLQLNPIQV